MSAEQRSTRNSLLREAEVSEDFDVMDADLAKSTRGGWFRNEYPDRWFNMGIAKQDLFAAAAGIATTGRVSAIRSISNSRRRLGRT